MPGFPDEDDAPTAPEPVTLPAYSILKQRVDLDVDFATQSLTGSTEISLQPLIKDLKQIRLHCRQCRPTAIQASGITAKWELGDPYRRSHMDVTATIQQHEMLRSKIQASLRPRPEPELLITLPAKLKIHELHIDPTTALPQYDSDAVPSLQKQETDAMAVVETPTVQSAAQLQGPQFAPIKLYIEFQVDRFRDGVHWVGCIEGDRRFPYMYTKAEPWPGNSSCIFPCVDDAKSRCSWEISIRCPRTLGDAFKILGDVVGEDARRTRDAERAKSSNAPVEINGANNEAPKAYSIDLAASDAALDLTVICTGEAVDELVDPDNESRHTVSFSLAQPVTARHVGFAIGPFENVNLSSSRNSEQEEKLGQSAVRIDGYCLPGRAKELQNTCLPSAWAIDFFGVSFGSFPFSSYQVLFVDDFMYDTVALAGLSICSANLLFPKSIIKPIDRNTRTIVRTLAEQWAGVSMIAQETTDAWVVSGMAGFMTDFYMRRLAGNNEFRWHQKLASEKVYELDVDRPSIRNLGEILHLDHTIRDFVNLKSALILFILDRRLMKSSGTTGVTRVINKMFLHAKTGTMVNGELASADFQRLCEKLGHTKLDAFFKQWVHFSGCPIFYVTQKFNKKKLVVEMTIMQRQTERKTKPAFEPSNFMREIKEHVQDVWAPVTNAVFTGPMTIRIHEADGTPYEHIVEIKEPITRLEIPYNTKYKRLKRSRRQKERQMAEGATTEAGDDALLYCLGDILDTEEDRKEWNLMDWTEEDEEKMGQESYEWIRMDADFEWIGKIHLVMPLYMYISQLQQDRDIVAQYDSMRYLLGSNPHHVNLTILVRTLMDVRYFWGIREMAAEGLATCAKDKVMEIGQYHLTRAFKELYFMRDENLPKSNDFSDRRSFIIQCAIPCAMTQLRDVDGKVPMQIRRLFIDLLKFNDNSNNRLNDGDPESPMLSDCHYIATLMNCLADSVIASHREPQPTYDFSFDDDEPMTDTNNPDKDFEELAIEQIDRHRRIDEWDPSYHNVYSTTALECLQRLANAGIVKKNTEIIKYARAGNADNVRLVAYRCLSETGVLRSAPALRFLLHQLVEDMSPFFRDNLLRVFGEALGHIALGDADSEKVPEQPSAEVGLVVEQETSNEQRQIEATRKVNPDVAILALKRALQGHETFGKALWYAATSPDLSVDEIAAFCDIAALFHEPVTSHIVVMKLPRPWRCENLGRGQVRFFNSGPYRTAPRKGLALEDWQRLQELELAYTGALSYEVVKKQKEIPKVDQEMELKLKIAQTQEQLQLVQHGRSSSVTAPLLPTPSAEKSGFKLTLGAGSKRKQSIDSGVPSRAGSPKSQKVSRQQTPSGALKSKISPNRNQRRSSTPSSIVVASSKTKPRLIVVLRLGAHANRAHQILSSASQKGRKLSLSKILSQTSSSGSRSFSQPPFPSTLVQSPTNSMNYFTGNNAFSASPPQPAMNLGGFRSYGPTTTAPVDGDKSDVNATEVKLEGSDSLPLASLSRPSGLSISPPSITVPTDNGMPPPPKPKIKIRVGSGTGSGSQGGD